MRMNVMVMVVTRVAMFVPLGTTARRSPPTIKAIIIESALFILYPLGFPAVLRMHSLQSQFVHITARRRLRDITWHGALSGGSGAP